MEHGHGGGGGGAAAGVAPAPLHKPGHGSYEGHVLPGAMFILWATWWAVSIFAQYLDRSRSGRAFKARAWYPWPFRPCKHLEPWLKIAFALIGALVEIRLGHSSWRHVYYSNGRFDGKHANNWQHAIMYLGFGVSGAVDVLGVHQRLPEGTEKAFLSLAFLCEMLLMWLHAKHHELDVLVHQLLSSLMIGCAVVSLMEIAWRNSVLLATARAALVFFQGTWFIQVGHMLFLQRLPWDMHDAATLMYAPMVFCVHLIAIAVGFLLTFVAMQLMLDRLHVARNGGARLPAAVKPQDRTDKEEHGEEHKVLIAKEYKD